MPRSSCPRRSVRAFARVYPRRSREARTRLCREKDLSRDKLIGGIREQPHCTPRYAFCTSGSFPRTEIAPSRTIRGEGRSGVDPVSWSLGGFVGQAASTCCFS